LRLGLAVWIVVAWLMFDGLVWLVEVGEEIIESEECEL
jgi:hypothetical protein